MNIASLLRKFWIRINKILGCKIYHVGHCDAVFRLIYNKMNLFENNH